MTIGTLKMYDSKLAAQITKSGQEALAALLKQVAPFAPNHWWYRSPTLAQGLELEILNAHWESTIHETCERNGELFKLWELTH